MDDRAGLWTTPMTQNLTSLALGRIPKGDLCYFSCCCEKVLKGWGRQLKNGLTVRRYRV